MTNLRLRLLSLALRLAPVRRSVASWASDFDEDHPKACTFAWASRMLEQQRRRHRRQMAAAIVVAFACGVVLGIAGLAVWADGQGR